MMMAKFVCPNCHDELEVTCSNNSKSYKYKCKSCEAVYSTREGVPVLIYPLLHTELSEKDKELTRRFKNFLLFRGIKLLLKRIAITGWIASFKLIPAYFLAKIYNYIIVTYSWIAKSKKVKCSCCGWQGLKFGTYWSVFETINDFECPKCTSHPRQRFLSKNINKLIDITSGDIESVFKQSNSDSHRITTDIAMPGVNCYSNINFLPFSDSSFNNIICVHVLEHIEDDRRAMRELFRVLKAGGIAVICVPETDNYETIEFGFADPDKTEHWRSYGQDVRDRLTDAGFNVETITTNEPEEEIKRFGLSKNEKFHLCIKY
jgi:uncharacterized protein YbaR (Trm112 family)